MCSVLSTAMMAIAVISLLIGGVFVVLGIVFWRRADHFWREMDRDIDAQPVRREIK